MLTRCFESEYVGDDTMDTSYGSDWYILLVCLGKGI